MNRSLLGGPRGHAVLFTTFVDKQTGMSVTHRAMKIGPALVLLIWSSAFAIEENCPKLLMPELKISLVQYPISGNKGLHLFLHDLESSVRDAKQQGSQLVVFPELPALDLLRSDTPLSEEAQFRTIATQVTPLVFTHAQTLARLLDISILIGSYPRLEAGQVVNTAMLAFADGRSIFQDKLFLTPDEIAWNWKPGNELKVFDAPWGKTVILICYDSEFPMISSLLAEKNPELILVPSMTSEKGFYRVRWSAQARAVEHYAFVAHTGTVQANPAQGDHHAQASFLSPQDQAFSGVLAEGTQNIPQLVTTKLDLAKLREHRKTAGTYPAKHQVQRTSPITVVDSH